MKALRIGLLIIVMLCVSYSVNAMSYQESPMLQDRVAAGELPPVEERLPLEPVVMEPLGEIGTYGGELRMAFTGRHFALQSMLGGRFSDQEAYTWSRDASEIIPNWVVDTTFDEDGLGFTVHLREGVRWSDGTLLTVDDFLFSYDHIALNADLNPVPPTWLAGVEYEKIDDFTLRFSLPEAMPEFRRYFTSNFISGANDTVLAKHYFSTLHPDFADAAELEAAIAAEGVDSWQELFEVRVANDNPDKPVLKMWRVVEASTDRVIAERNPYFWKVDTEGNQLPYVDRVRMDIVSSGDVVTMRAMAGEYDFVIFHIGLADFPTLVANEDQGGYDAFLWEGTEASLYLLPNHSYQGDEALAELLRTPDFKKALSHAIDRTEVNELVYMGTGRPIALSPLEGSPVFREHFPEQYADFDLQKAEELLESIGVVDTTGDGWRNLPNGDDLRIDLIATSGWDSHIEASELVKDYWDNLGINTRLEVFSFERRSQIETASTFHISMWKISNMVWPTNLGTSVHAPFSEGSFAPEWTDWLASGGTQGVEPSAELLAANDIFQELLRETDEQRREQLGVALWENFYENLWTIGIVQQVPRPIVVNRRLKNVPAEVVESWDPLRSPSNAYLATWYIQQ